MALSEARRIYRLEQARRGGTPPTVRAFADAIGAKSTRTAFRYLRQLRVKRICSHCNGRGWMGE